MLRRVEDEEEEEGEERSSIRGRLAGFIPPEDPPLQRVLKLTILLAPWVVGVVLLWRSPIYLAVFLGLSFLFATVQRPIPTRPKKRRSKEDEGQEKGKEARRGVDRKTDPPNDSTR